MPAVLGPDQMTPAQVMMFNRRDPQAVQQMFGDSADRLIKSGFDIGVLRPWVGSDGRHYMTLNANTPREQIVTTNAPATLPYEAWKAYDDAVVEAVTSKLRAVADIRGAGLEYTIPNGLGHTVLQYQTMGDITDATISMDPIRRSETDTPQGEPMLLPLPVIHKDLDYSARQISVSQGGRTPMPVDTGSVQMAARKVAEGAEKLLTGTAGSFSYGGGTIYGMTNLPQRATKTDMPTPDGTNGPAVITAILALRQMLINNKHTGPYVFYVNTQWASVLDNDFSATKGDQTLRQRILAIDGITDVRVLDFLPTTKYTCILQELQSESIRMVIGMEVQTLQWESMGGLMKHFKVMCIIIPQLRPDTANNSGTAMGTNAP